MKAAAMVIVVILISSFILGHYDRSQKPRETSLSTTVNLVLQKKVGVGTEVRDDTRYEVEVNVSTNDNASGRYAHFSIFDPESKRETVAMATEIAKEYKINAETFLCVLNAESGIESTSRIDGSLKCGDNGASCGLGQIKCGTWQSIRKHAGWDTDCQLRANDKENLKTTAYGLATVWKYHWTGYRNCEAVGYKL